MPIQALRCQARTMARTTRLSALALLAASPIVSAQRLAPGDLSSSLRLTGLTQLDTDIDNGGRFR